MSNSNPWNNGAFILLALCLSLSISIGPSGCSRRRTQEEAVSLVVLGRGITNLIEIGMTLNQVGKARSDLVVTTYRENRQGFWRFLPGKRVVSHVASIPALGVTFRVDRPNFQINEITFDVSPASSTNRYHGTLTCGLSFTNGQGVQRQDLARVMGEATRLGTNSILEFFRSGQNFSWQPNASTEMIYYPATGVAFRLTEGTGKGNGSVYQFFRPRSVTAGSVLTFDTPLFKR